VAGTGGKGDTGMIRLDFQGFSGAESLGGSNAQRARRPNARV